MEALGEAKTRFSCGRGSNFELFEELQVESDFGGHAGAMLGLCWSQVGPQVVSKREKTTTQKRAQKLSYFGPPRILVHPRAEGKTFAFDAPTPRADYQLITSYR